MKWSGVRSRMLAIVIAIAVLSGCSVIGAPIAEKIATGVERYCEEPYAYRNDYRNTINAQLTESGHQVHVHCAGDPTSDGSTSTGPGVKKGNGQTLIAGLQDGYIWRRRRR